MKMLFFLDLKYEHKAERNIMSDPLNIYITLIKKALNTLNKVAIHFILFYFGK